MDDADLEDDGDERRKGGEGVQMAEREAISVSIPELLVCIVSKYKIQNTKYKIQN